MKKIFIILGLGVLLGGWYFLFVKKLPKVEPKISNTQVEKQTLLGLAKELGVKAKTRDDLYVNWILADGKSVPLNSQEIILGTNGINGIGKYGNFTTDELMKVNPEFLTRLAVKIKSYYKGNGFKESLKNTNNVPNDLWFLTLGFEKEGILCVNRLAKQSDPFGYLSCGTIDKKQVKYQEEFKTIYEYYEKKFKSEVPFVFRVQKVSGNYALGSASSIGGVTWMGQKTDGNWKSIWEGQEIARCEDMQKFKVPKAIYGSCYNALTGQVEK